jgi:hypothetical protein
MAVKYTVPVDNAQAASELTEQLRADGLVNGRDFTWRFYPKKYDHYDSDNNRDARVEFEFTDEKMATFYRLKWS